MRVIAYVRVSTNEQAETGVSLVAQEQKIRGYCKLNGWKCVEVICDDGYSAGNLKRPGLKSYVSSRVSPKGLWLSKPGSPRTWSTFGRGAATSQRL